jgi:archaellum component FlaC
MLILYININIYQNEVKHMDEKILSLLEELIENQKNTDTKLDRFEKDTSTRLDRFEKDTSTRLDRFEKDTGTRLDRIENKLDAVIEQTADLTEFRTEMSDFRHEASSSFEEIKDNLNSIEVITAGNWKDIARLKSVK